MTAMRNLAIGCFFGVLFWGLVMMTGWRPASAQTEPIGATVRENPGSYKPGLAAHTGYITQRPGRSGRGIILLPGPGRSSGGGYRSGK